MKKQNANTKNSHKINVSIRLRPPRSTSSSTSVDVTSAGEIKVKSTKNESKTYNFSVVEGSDQELAYNRIAQPLLDGLRRGPCTLCAYGQSGSGKTHTVFGPPGCLTVTSVAQAKGGIPNEWGFFPRLVLDILRMDPRSVVYASAIEIYQDAPYDLLADRAPLSVGTKRAGLKVGGGQVTVHGNDRASNHCGTHPPGCSCRKCFEAITKLKAMHAAAARNGLKKKSPQQKKQNDQQRDEFATVGETLQRLETAEDIARFALLVEGTRTSVGHALNDRSSRSHCLINIHISFHATAGAKKKVQRKLLVVDLAGSERIAKSGVTGVARHQATSINGSLTVLGKVARALSTSQRHVHVPYRDSTLTMLLRKSLDDAMASTVFVINIAPDTDHIEESICSLNFAKSLRKAKQRQEITSGIELPSSCSETENELESLLGQLQEAKTKLAQAEVRGQGEQFNPTAPDGEVQLLKKNLKRVKEEEAKVRAARFDLAELRALCKGTARKDQNTGNTCSSLKKVASAEIKLAAREKELRNYQDIVARQMSIRGLYRPAKDVYQTCEREVRHLEAQIEMLRAQP